MDPVGNRSRSSSAEWDSAEPGGADGSGPQLCVDAPPNASRAEEEPLASPNPAVRSLVEAYDASARTAAAPALPRDSNAARTLQRDSSLSYAESGTTEGGARFAGVAALKTRDPRTGVDVEVFTASAQVGTQNEVQAGLARTGYSGEIKGASISVSAEALTARAHAGMLTDDGSYGPNFGAMATGAGIEATVSYSGWSVTAGVSISVGAAVSSGERNSDGDSVPERCFKASFGPTTLGFCSEL